MSVKKYIGRVLVAFDQAFNVLGGGHPDETISARTGRDAIQGKRWALMLQWALNNIQPHHTIRAIEHDRERGVAVQEVEQDFQDKHLS